MTPDRWAEVARLCEEALTRNPADRASFIAAACSGDIGLRREVESLLEQESSGEGFLSSPAVAFARDLMADEPAIGRQLGPYVLTAHLGAGGMGDVYRAHDTRLGRDVAIKILPQVFTTDPERLGRFQREARLLAALNHPNIGAIYGLEQVDGVPALVLELVEGLTLAERLTGGALPVSETLMLAVQIVDALEAAHSRGIIHRDLKPANIKITPQGAAKVLDFGLAKDLGCDFQAHIPLTEPAGTSRDASAPGRILGTVDYMSPEQARGEPLDARSDIFSFGIVLKEMLTARPSGGATAPARRLNPTVPPALERIILKLLSTDRGARYQIASQLGVDLKRLQRELDGRRDATSARRGILAAAALSVAAGIGFWLWPRIEPPPARTPREYAKVTDFADSAVSPSLSPDGRLLTFIRGEETFEGRGDVYLKALPDGVPVPLTHDRLEKMSPVFSPDGQRIAYTAVTGTFVWDTWVVSLTEREPRPWLVNASGLTWIGPQRIMFSAFTQGLHMRVVAADENRAASASAVYSPSHERGMAHRSLLSPDGQSALVVEMEAPVWQRCRLVPANGESAGRRVGPDGQCTSAAWSPDGRWMYFSSNVSGAFHIWRQKFPDGMPEQITAGPTEEEGVAPAPDGASLFTSIGSRQSSIWVHDARGDRELSSEGYAFVPVLPNGVSQPFSADGRTLFYLVRKGANRFSGPQERTGELWMAALETGRAESLFPGMGVVGYDVSRDGRQIVFAAVDGNGKSHIWLAPLERRSAAHQLSPLEADSPRFGAAGDILCRGTDGQSSFIYKLNRDSGRAEKAVAVPVLFFVSASPDGAWLIARVTAGVTGSSQTNVAFPTAGGSAVPVCDACIIDWTPSTRSLIVRLGDERQSGRTFVIGLKTPGTLPRLPSGGMHTRSDVAGLALAHSLDGSVYPGSDEVPQYAFQRSTVQRNIYRVPLP
jgi:eukaryotic-like serine/threonine-protein kinase